ncbi:MAG: divalent-cation tolerance protein CutA [Spirochaetia bacterium]|nr:divalent-cation tolerance protein CutA [Spirochaetia bacterium]
MSEDPVIMIYVTLPSESEALKIGEILVEERLAACINIFPEIKSIYRWEGRVITDKETVMVCKSVQSKFKKVSARIIELHSYTCPCIISYPSSDGYPEYMKWVADETE